MKKPYRPNVAAMLRRPADGKILLAERINIPGAWQLPQGGVDAGESKADAVVREVLEELGVHAHLLRVLAEAPPLRYDFPEDYSAPIAREFAGQTQTVFLMDFLGTDDDFDLAHFEEPEFCATQWVEPRAAPPMIWAMKRHIVQAAIDVFAPYLSVS